MPGSSQVVTYAVDGSDPQPLTVLGHVGGLKYSFTLPGGCDQMSCTLEQPPAWRTRALDPGRMVQVIRGGVVWAGKLDEPAPGAAGWSVTAHGAGTFGGEFMASYAGVWATVNPDNAINGAITRGLDWVNPGLNGTSGLWLGEPSDTASVTVADMLTNMCSKGGLTWQVVTGADGTSVLAAVTNLTPAPNRLLVTADPAARTLGGDINRIFIRYQATPDLPPTAATYGTTQVNQADSQAKHGPMETFIDLSGNGAMPVGDANAVGNAVLRHYVRASFTGAFAVRPGQLLNMGGQPADLGVYFQADTQAPGMCCQLILGDFGYGGEVVPGAVQFLVGAYEYDQDSNTAAVTPFQSMRTDFASLLAARASTAKAHPYRTRRVRAWVPGHRTKPSKTFPKGHWIPGHRGGWEKIFAGWK